MNAHGLLDDDEAAIAAMTDAERADLDNLTRTWDHAAEMGMLREALAICTPALLIILAILLVAWGV